RRTTEDASAAGFYRYFSTSKDEQQKLEFRPLIQGLDHGMAQYVAEAFAGHLYTYPDPALKKLEQFAQQIQSEMQGDADAMPQSDISQAWSLDL
ncbi:MAG: hypothetical protein K8S97_07155, partial [Anaerolineae bacterium]|nr:hypothetical protein [Anaerolineae bacterium]